MYFRYPLSVLLISIRHSLFRSISRNYKCSFAAMSSTIPYVRKSGEEMVKCFPEKYDALFSEKIVRLKDLLKDSITEGLFETGFEAFESPKTHFRMRYDCYTKMHATEHIVNPCPYFLYIPEQTLTFGEITVKILNPTSGIMRCLMRETSLFLAKYCLFQEAR